MASLHRTWNHWFINRQPDKRLFFKNNILSSEIWYHNDLKRVITYDTNGTKSLEVWYLKDQIHRDYGPALVRYHQGQVIMRKWMLFGQPHRSCIHGPAIIIHNYKNQKEVTREAWMIYGHLHNLRGPAITVYDHKSQKYLSYKYFVFGLESMDQENYARKVYSYIRKDESIYDMEDRILQHFKRVPPGERHTKIKNFLNSI